MPEAHTARRLVERLERLRSPDELAKYTRYFKTGPGEYANGDTFMGVRMPLRGDDAADGAALCARTFRSR